MSGEWQVGTVIAAPTFLTTVNVRYGPPEREMNEDFDRYQDDLIKSTQEFINNRREWRKGSEVEVYSEIQKSWYQGRIEEVISAGDNQPFDIFRIFYTDNLDKDYSKYLDRWSPELRISQISPELQKYKKGTKVYVWSVAKQAWMAGVVIELVPQYEVVNVRYGDDKTKLVPVSSDDIKLYDGD